MKLRLRESDWLDWVIFVLTLIMLLVVFKPNCSHAAVWVPVRFIVGGTRTPVKMIAKRWQAPGPIWYASSVWEAPDVNKGPLVPHAAGIPDTAWFSSTDNPSMWRAGGSALRIAAVFAQGDTSRWSNVQLIATGCPRDTALFDSGGSTWYAGSCQAWSQTVPNKLQPAIWQATWVRAPGDTNLVPLPTYVGFQPRGPIMHFDDLLRSVPAGLSPIYNKFCLKGTR